MTPQTGIATGFCNVQNKIFRVPETALRTTPTYETYAPLQAAYDFFNVHLFGNALCGSQECEGTQMEKEE